MAIAYLNPASATTNTNWDSSTVSELDQGETANIWTSTANNAALVVTLDDFDYAGLGVSSITSVQIIIVGRYNNRVGQWTARTSITNASGTSYYLEDLTVPAGRTVSTVSGTVRTTSDGANPWTDSNLDGMKLELASPDCLTLGELDQFYIKVIYATGYGNTVNKVIPANISKINGIATADISKVNGI
tara:strand:+ start:2198 stop:2761 length:564 start_codon:yes stop_codon:yes gene_type:complete